MHKLLLTVLTIFLIGCAGNQVFAQQKIAPQKEALIKELLNLTGGEESVEKISTMMMEFQRAESEKMVMSMIDDDTVLTPDEKAELKKTIAESTGRLVKRLEEFFTKEINLSGLLEEVAIPIYDKNFTEAELREMVAFFKTPAGQKSIKLAPEMMMASMKAFSEKLVPKLMDFVKSVTEEEVARMKQKLEDTKKTKPLPKT